MAAPKGAPSLHRLRSEEGAVAVLTALLLIVIFASVAFAIDLARLRHERHVLQAAVDLGSLAGAGHLPVRGAAEAGVAASAARNIAVANAPGLAGGGLDINFKCIVAGLDDGSIADMSYACGPAGGGTWGSGWTMKRHKAFHDCNPYAGDLCNTIIARASSIVPYFFAPVIGVNQGSTGAVQGAACKGFCGDPSAPLDVVMVLDRSTSMTTGDMANLKNAALSVLDVYDPAIQSVALVALPYPSATNKCIANPIQAYPAVGRMWQVTAFSSDYKTSSGTINTSSDLVAKINCMQRATNLDQRDADRVGSHRPGRSDGDGGQHPALRRSAGCPRRDHLHDGRRGEPAQEQPAVPVRGHPRHERRDGGHQRLHDRLRRRVGSMHLRHPGHLSQRLRLEVARRHGVRWRAPTTSRAGARRPRTPTATTTSASPGAPTWSRCSGRSPPRPSSGRA